MNILVVNDEQLVLDGIVMMIKKVLKNANVFSFTETKDALNFAKTNKTDTIDLAVLDINMRFINGVTMAKELQVIYPKLNIIFCTGYTEYVVDALGVSCSEYVLKPITEESLKTALQHLKYSVE